MSEADAHLVERIPQDLELVVDHNTRHTGPKLVPLVDGARDREQPFRALERPGSNCFHDLQPTGIVYMRSDTRY